VPPRTEVAAQRGMATRSPVALPAREEAAAPPEATSGWKVVAGAFLVTMVGFGAIYSYAECWLNRRHENCTAFSTFREISCHLANRADELLDHSRGIARPKG
jgi:hypothetical protein